MAMGFNETMRKTILRKGRMINNIEYLSSNFLVKELKWEENPKKVYLIFEDDFIQIKSSQNSRGVIKKCSQDTHINYQIYNKLDGDVKLIYISPENKGIVGIGDDIENYISFQSSFDDYDEIIAIGKGIGGIVASLVPENFKEKEKIKLVTISTPYWGITPIPAYTRRKFISRKNELLRELFDDDFFKVAEYSLQDITHINYVTDDIRKYSYIIETVSQEIPEEFYTKKVRRRNFSDEEVLKEAIDALISGFENSDEVIYLEF